jgi:hypothetical protein
VPVPKIFYPALAALISPSKFFFPPVHCFNLGSIALQPGQAVVQGRLSLMFVSVRILGLWPENMIGGLVDVLPVGEVQQLKFRQKN